MVFHLHWKCLPMEWSDVASCNSQCLVWRQGVSMICMTYQCLSVFNLLTPKEQPLKNTFGPTGNIAQTSLVWWSFGAGHRRATETEFGRIERSLQRSGTEKRDWLKLIYHRKYMLEVCICWACRACSCDSTHLEEYALEWFVIVLAPWIVTSPHSAFTIVSGMS